MIYPSLFKSSMDSTGKTTHPIYKARKRANLSQRALLRLIGIDRVALRLWEKTGKEPKLYPSQMEKLLELLECDSISEIIPDKQA